MSGKKEFVHILSPIKIGPIELKNRIVLAPMNEALSGAHGELESSILHILALGQRVAPGSSRRVRSWAPNWRESSRQAGIRISTIRDTCLE